MDIKMISNPITPYGSFSIGQVISDAHYPVAFLNHLVDDCHAAERVDYETKIDPRQTENKGKGVSKTKTPSVNHPKE